MARLLALDLGTKTGWALADPPRIVASGVELFLPKRWEGGGMRFLRFRRWLDELVGLQPFTEVAYEEVRAHTGTDASHLYGGLLATLSLWCEEQVLPYQGVPVASIKRHATGKGNAPKVDIVRAMRKLGHAPADDNEADALALAHVWLDGLTVPRRVDAKLRSVP